MLVGAKREIDQNTDARAADPMRPWAREERDEEDRREQPEVETKRSMRNRQRPQHLKDYYVQYNTQRGRRKGIFCYIRVCYIQVCHIRVCHIRVCHIRVCHIRVYGLEEMRDLGGQ